MSRTEKPTQSESKPVPAVLLLAESARLVEVEGEFDARTQTWSNRKYECAAQKKHNEAM
jgi:hypothetical protein